jgi:hypothetical protein
MGQAAQDEGCIMSFAAGFLIFCIVALCIPALQRAVGALVLVAVLLLVFAP